MSTRYFKNYNYDKTVVTAVEADDTGTKYLWIAFSKNMAGNCLLWKVSANNPSQKFYEFTHAVEKIVAMKILENYIFLALDDSINLGYFYARTAPITTQNAIVIPSGVNEAPVDIAVDSINSKVYFLTPGNESGEVAKIIKCNNVGIYEETIELSESGTIINNAKSITVDSNGDIWVATYTDPVELVRIFENSGGIYEFEVTEIV